MPLFTSSRRLLALCVFGVVLATASTNLAADSFPAQVSVYFSPYGGCTEAIVQELGAARKQVPMQAYSFTSAPIAKALVDAKKRGIEVKAVLDKSNETAQYSSATFLANADLPVLIDDQHAIAHNKIMIIDGATVLTGSFNFTKAAEEKNAENLVVLKGSSDLAQRYSQNFELHAAHSHPYKGMGAGTPHASESRSSAPEEAGGSIHANRQSKVYHLPACLGYTRVSEKNTVMFSTEAAARKAGYRKAKNCP
jgi:phosphatidylserine/phosphatidylglycerophosphate/cardiolipin synthase-like enzyme